jgi:hypothetical protein
MLDDGHQMLDEGHQMRDGGHQMRDDGHQMTQIKLAHRRSYFLFLFPFFNYIIHLFNIKLFIYFSSSLFN